MADVILYNFAASPFGRRVYFCLLYKGISFKTIFVNTMTWQELEFVPKRVVPTLTIGRETRQDSFELCLWLDEFFSETPKVGGLSPSERERIRELNVWVDNTLFSNHFRMMVDPFVRDYDWYSSRLRSWAVSNATSAAPEELREQWPFLALSTPFVYEHAAASFAAGPAYEVLQRAVDELEKHIGMGPFMGGFEAPTAADLSAYGQISLNELVGCAPREDVLKSQVIRNWIGRLENHLPDGIDMIPEELRRVSLPLVKPDR